jgi:plastocyanin
MKTYKLLITLTTGDTVEYTLKGKHGHYAIMTRLKKHDNIKSWRIEQ